MRVFSDSLTTFAAEDPVPWMPHHGGAPQDVPKPFQCLEGGRTSLPGHVHLEQALACRGRKALVERLWARR